MTTTRTWLTAALAMAIGVALGALPRDDAGPQQMPAVAAARGAPEAGTELNALRAELAAERLERMALEVEIASLREGVEDTRTPAEPGPSWDGWAPDRPAAAAPGPEGGILVDEFTYYPRGDPKRLRGPHWFDERALIELGVSSQEAAELRARFADAEMAKLYLRDSAARGGWIRTPRYRRAVEAHRAAFREEVGDRDYDLALYAAGRKNRVAISHVIDASPARDAGIERGDVIVRYDDRPIFRMNELVGATRRGRAGSSVAVDVLRDGEQRRYYMARGPLGVGLTSVRRAPEPQ